MNRSLQTIKDFDIGVGSFWTGNRDNALECVRMPGISAYQTTQSEIKFILWLLLEQEFKSSAGISSIGCDIGNSDLNEGRDEPDTHREDSSVSSDLTAKAREYAAQLLEPAGVELPFERLPKAYKESLFRTFCPSNELLASEKFSNIVELYEILRRQSMLQGMYERQAVLGKGTYGEVSAVISTEDEQLLGQRLALKRVVASWNSVEDIQMIFNECNILKKLSGHPRLLQYKKSWLALGQSTNRRNGSMREELVFYLLMDLCGQSLQQWKNDVVKAPLDEEVVFRILYQILEGLHWIHTHNCLHLDLNPGNIFWTSSECTHIKIGDFGLAVEGPIYEGKSGTVPYAAPEDLMTVKSDIYSAGVTILDVASNYSTVSELIENANRISQPEYIAEGEFLTILKLMLAYSPNDRLPANNLKDLIPVSFRL